MPDLAPWMPVGPRDDTYDTTPTNATQVTASATPHTLGTITEIIASTDCDADLLVVEQSESIGANGVATGLLATFYVDDGSGDQAVIGPVEYGSHRGNVILDTIMFPLFVPRGAQILAAVQAVVGSDTATFRVRLRQASGRTRPGRRCASYGASTATSVGASVSGGSAAWGSWTQIVDPTTAPARWLVPSVGASNTSNNTATRYLQIGVGAAASERPVGQWAFTTTTAEEVNPPVGIPVPVDLPVGVRLSARVWSTSGTTAQGVTVHTFD